MAYDNTKDELVEEMGQVPNTDFWVEIRAYDEGEKKLSIYRKFVKQSGVEKRRQVVRLTFNEGVNLGEWLSDFAAENGVGEPAVEELAGSGEPVASSVPVSPAGSDEEEMKF
jgi:hypothetical protein